MARRRCCSAAGAAGAALATAAALASASVTRTQDFAIDMPPRVIRAARARKPGSLPGPAARVGSRGLPRRAPPIDDGAVWCAAVVVGALATAPAAITPARIDAAREVVLDDDYQPAMPHAH